MKLSFNTVKVSATTLLISMLLFVSCQKEDSQNGTTEEQETEASKVSGEADAEAEVIFDNLFDDVMGANDEVGNAGSGVFFGRTDSLTPVPRCFTVTVTHPNNTPFPVKIVVDFGNVGCPGPDGHVRRGKVITVYTNRMIAPGAVAETSFDNHYVDSIKVEGTHRIENITLATTPVNNRRFKITVTEGKLTKPNGNYVRWNSTKFITHFEGVATPGPLDDIFRIEGSARGQVLRNNLLVGWESTITEPLVRRMTCRWIVKGVIKTVRLNTTTANSYIAYLNFGNGQCDNKAVLTVNGVSHIITLP
ncbi:MAG TPA: hypothetical protein PKA77_08870 [Chitinophagaceae bacterium]|jgi:hypothetical protein|nr:hypothetical protein [Chitinophagaceae bacterium]HMU58590.1 hypothetical protein [Chitinophagaceae bacterium]